MDEYPGSFVQDNLSLRAQEAGFTCLSSQALNDLAYLIFKSPDGIPEPETIPEEFKEDTQALQSTPPTV